MFICLNGRISIFLPPCLCRLHISGIGFDIVAGFTFACHWYSMFVASLADDYHSHSCGVAIGMRVLLWEDLEFGPAIVGWYTVCAFQDVRREEVLFWFYPLPFLRNTGLSVVLRTTGFVLQWFWLSPVLAWEKSGRFWLDCNRPVGRLAVKIYKFPVRRCESACGESAAELTMILNCIGQISYTHYSYLFRRFSGYWSWVTPGASCVHFMNAFG